MKKIIALALALLMVLPMTIFGVSADSVTPDTTWHNATDTEFTLSDAGDLLGFSQLLASGETFSGKTVKLDADIVLNAGDAALWANEAPAISWTSAGTFSGTFDGQGHSISGVYCVGSSEVGFFREVRNATIKNLSIVNSYFSATGNTVAAFVALVTTGVTVENCYSDAIVSAGGANAGGFVSVLNGTLKTEAHLKNLWFDGSISLTDRYAAGIMANANVTDNGPQNKVFIDTCLNSGTVHTTHSGGIAHIAGILGRNDGYSEILHCLNVGKISSANTEGELKDVLGSLVGKTGNATMLDANTYKAHLTIKNSWATKESCPNVVGLNASPDPTQVIEYGDIPSAMLKSYSAYANTTLDFENRWAVNLDGFPLPQSFVPADKIPPLYKVNSPTMSEAELKVDGHYGPRWTVSVEIPEGFTADDVTIGALIVPTKAIPKDHIFTLEDKSFEYRGNEYEVANVEGKILRESEEGTLVATFVVTDLGAETARMNFTAVPYVTYTVAGGNAISMLGDAKSMTFYRDMVLSLEDADAEHQAKVETVLAPIDEAMGGRFPVAEVWGDEDVFEEVPALIAPDTVITASEHYGDNNYVISVDGTVDDDYLAYLELLESLGFTKVYDNGDGIEEAVFNTTYKKGDLFVTVTNMSYRNITTIAAKWDLPLSDHLYGTVSEAGTGKVTMHVAEMVNWGNSILFQLNNGHFVMNDGATYDDLPYLLDYMESLTPGDEKPVVEAWFITHMHYDHYSVLEGFSKHPEWVDRVYVNGVYINEPNDSVKDTDKGVYDESLRVKKGISLLKTETGETPEIYRPQTGQRYYFNGMTVEILLAQDQIPFSSYHLEDGFNGSSTWYRHHIGDQDVLIAGDSYFAGMETIMESFERETLDFDIFFALHHGFNTWNTFTNFCNFHTVVYCYSHVTDKDNYYQEPFDCNAKLLEKLEKNNGEYMLEEGGTVVFTFPYTVGSSQKLPSNITKYKGIYHN